MGLRFRKSINVGGFRINLSKSGIGYSCGIKGYRVTHKATGGTRTTASLSGTGVSYVKETSNKNGAKPKSAANMQSPYNSPNDNEIKSTLVNSSQNEFVDKLNKATSLPKKLKALRIASLIFFILLGCVLMNFIHQAIVIPFVAIALLCYFLIPKNVNITADFVFDSNEYREMYMSIIDALTDLNNVDNIMEIASYNTTYNASSITSQTIKISEVNYINSNLELKSFKIQGKEILFLPNIIAVLDNGKWFSIEWKLLKINFTTSIFTTALPAGDTIILNKKYQYQTKSGVPDKRYKYNPLIYECEYGAIELKSDSGLHTAFIVSNKTSAQKFFEAVSTRCEILNTSDSL